MNNKNVLVFLVVLLVYVNVYMPLSDENRKLVKMIASTRKSIQKDKYYLENVNYISQELNQSNEINSLYHKKLFFMGASSQILNIMQKEIKSIISESGVHEDLITWGEKYTDSEMFEVFPMQVRVSGSVKKLGSFFDRLYQSKKIKIKEFNMMRTREHYILRISIFGIKRV